MKFEVTIKWLRGCCDVFVCDSYSEVDGIVSIHTTEGDQLDICKDDHIESYAVRRV